ncbi:Alpha/Beta hydrolase protein [Zychaea mexicana]|uniref:Alpha/Beta hydrolase protein n=1 Tax=Zychaea mexicana TaxID=64656 RepID=UPI0022FE745A|nr:Alpha/Beta hydrolase protein [Zychaea mexicana]KAI9494254.1 Alpha/Beta hydrolase protein [Zychaea mexicana]
MVNIKPFGAWPSPVSADSLAAGLSATDVCIDQQTVYWCEVVPSEQGRGQIFSRSLASGANSVPKPLLPLGYSCQSRVHEYGGGSFSVHNGLVVFSNDKDKRLYSIDSNNGAIEPITGDSKALLRYGDIKISDDNTYVVCVEEMHKEQEEPKDVVNRLVSVRIADGSVHVLAEGHDFYSTPRLSDRAIAYLSWDHSNMPWDFTQLNVADISPDGTSLTDSKQVPTAYESFVQPEFGADGNLYVASDRSGFWNLYRIANEGNNLDLLLPAPLEQEFAGAQWQFNQSWYSPFASDPTKLVCGNKDKLAILDTEAKTLTNIEPLSDYISFEFIHSYFDEELGQEVIVANATTTHSPCELIAYSVEKKEIRSLRPSTAPPLDKAYVSVGQEIEFPTTFDKTAYAYYYPPQNPDYAGPEGAKPPLRVLSHGGPTTQTSRGYNRAIQYWTTRGFAIVDVNYGGSTGYGREYRNRLKKMWGVVDVDDCCHAAIYLVKQGLADGKKLSIKGGSAGGFVTLAAVAFRDVFNAGCCLYGISDITLLAKETHKFESRYPDELIGEYPKDEEVYKERSPLFSADKITCPVIFFQGAEDKVVPPSQSEVMVDALKERGVPVAYVKYEGEAHGFRKAENIKRTVELEQWFYGQIFGFPVEGVEGVTIYNFPK